MDKTIKLNSNDESIEIYGSLDKNLRFAEKEYNVRISARNLKLKIIGDDDNVQKAYDFFEGLIQNYRQRGKAPKSPKESEEHDSKDEKKSDSKAQHGKVYYHHKGKIIRARSDNQSKYQEAIRDNDIVFGIGPAGTGKSYLAVAAGIQFLKKDMVSRIILTRPAVEAGENLGFLPGDLQEKVNPYLRPLFDALHDMMDVEEAHRLIDRGIIEIAPLAYMRGRTLNDAFVILDEAQNTTHAQMKMFLTRLGESSKTVVTGDITQIDLPDPKTSGLVEAKKILTGVRGIQFVQFQRSDVVRHPLVQEIIKAYDKLERKS